MGNHPQKYTERYIRIHKFIDLFLPSTISNIVIQYAKCISKLDPTDKFIEHYTTFSYRPEFISIYGDELYTIFNDVITVYDKRTLNFIKMFDRIRLDPPYCNQINGIIAADDAIYISNGNTLSIDVLDKSTGKCIRNIGKGTLDVPYGILIHREKLFVIDCASNNIIDPMAGYSTIRVFNRYTNVPIYNISTNMHCAKMTSSDTELFVSNLDRSLHCKISVYNINDGSLLRNITGSFCVHSLAIIGNELIMGDILKDTICIINKNGDLISSINNPVHCSTHYDDFTPFPFDLAIDNDILYVATANKIQLFNIY
jgi:hypothetical protein